MALPMFAKWNGEVGGTMPCVCCKPIPQCHHSCQWLLVLLFRLRRALALEVAASRVCS